MNTIKKLLIVFAVLVFGNNSMAQNGLESQLNIGFPSGTTRDTAALNISLDLAYLFADLHEKNDFVNESNREPQKNVQYGVSVGYSYTIGDKNFDDLQLMPIAAVCRFYFLDVLSLGGSIGYAVGLEPEVTDGGGYLEASFGIGVPRGSLSFSMRGVNLADGPEFELLTINVGLRMLLFYSKK